MKLRILIETCALFSFVLFGVISSANGDEKDPLAPLDEALKAVAAFEYGKDAGPLDRIEQIAVQSHRDPARRQAVEERLLKALEGPGTGDGKEFLCRQLRTIGTARSVPPLEALLTDERLSHVARLALGRFEEAEAGAALLRALGKTTGKIQAGIAGTLGDRRQRDATGELAKLLASPDGLIARAAEGALGKIGGLDSLRALEAARATAGEDRAWRLDAAILACADRLQADGETTEAVRIYKAFSAPGRPKHLRSGALRGLVAARGPDAKELLRKAIAESDPDLRADAIALAQSVSGPEMTKMLAELIPAAPPEAQARIIIALGARGDSAGVSSVAAATRSEHATVRAAAIGALGSLGGASAVDPLLRFAAMSTGGEQSAARESLHRLRGEGVEGNLVRAVASGDTKLRIESIRALAGRKTTAAAGEILIAARDEDSRVRSEAIGAIGAMADASSLSPLLALVVHPQSAGDRPAIERAITQVFARTEDREKRAEPVLLAYRGAPAEVKPALLRLLGATAAPGALATIREATGEADAAVKSAATSALADWPNASPAEDLLALANGTSDLALKSIALRGYLRMASLSKDPAAMYARALEKNDRPEDRRLVLTGLAGASSAEALAIVERHFSDPELRGTAVEAAVQIADRLRASDAARATAGLKNVIAVAVDPAVREKAQEIINKMEQFEGYILAWMGAGPYQRKGKDGPALFDVAFPPERPGNTREIEWKRLSKGVGSWDINLEEAIASADDCAGYLRTRIWSPAAQEARLELGSDDELKVWLGGKLVHTHRGDRSLAPRQDLVPVKLEEGWNDLLLKVIDHTGGWAFCCRVRKADGSGLDGLKVEAK